MMMVMMINSSYLKKFFFLENYFCLFFLLELLVKKIFDITAERLILGPVTWRWGTPGGSGNPPVHTISPFNLITFI